MQKIINIISGKGGTGKTLLTAVLADMLGNAGAKVLVVDLDVFVRGLTALLYFQKNETIKIIKDDKWSVSDFFKYKGDDKFDNDIAIIRYRSFDVFPSVASVDERLNLKDVMPNSVEEANAILTVLLDHIPEEYEFVFLDSRAGYDELIAATHSISNFSLSIEEDDDISMITSENLIEQLKHDSKNPILRIKNKARQIQEDSSSFGLSFVGNIPFDTDVLNNFGTKYFWDEIGKSLYKSSLINVWNSLAKKMGIDIYLKEKRISPLGNQRIERNLSMLGLGSRIMFVYGLIITLLSFFLILNGYGFIKEFIEDPIRLVGLVTSLIGVIVIVASVFSNNRK